MVKENMETVCSKKWRLSFGLDVTAIERAFFQKNDGVIWIWPCGEKERKAGKYQDNNILHSSSILQRVSVASKI